MELIERVSIACIMKRIWENLRALIIGGNNANRNFGLFFIYYC